MGRSVDELIAGLPKARRLKVEAKSQQLAREMIDHADSLSEIRKAFEQNASPDRTRTWCRPGGGGATGKAQ